MTVLFPGEHGEPYCIQCGRWPSRGQKLNPGSLCHSCYDAEGRDEVRQDAEQRKQLAPDCRPSMSNYNDEGS